MSACSTIIGKSDGKFSCVCLCKIVLDFVSYFSCKSLNALLGAEDTEMLQQSYWLGTTMPQWFMLAQEASKDQLNPTSHKTANTLVFEERSKYPVLGI